MSGTYLFGEPLEFVVSRRGETSLTASGNAGLLLLAGSATFIVAVAICISRSSFLLDSHNLSQFGAHPATALVFNGALILVGSFTLLAGWILRDDRSGLIAALCFLAGAGMIGAAVVHVGVDRHVHAVFAGLYYAGHLLLPLALSWSMRGALRTSSYFAIGLSITFLLLWAFANPLLFDAIGQGGAQLLTTLPLVLWMIAFSGRRVMSRLGAGARGRSRSQGLSAPGRPG